MFNTPRYASREYTAHLIALAKRGNPAKALVKTDLTGPDGQMKLTFAIDREALAQAQALDGKYLLGNGSWSLEPSALTGSTQIRPED